LNNSGNKRETLLVFRRAFRRANGPRYFVSFYTLLSAYNFFMIPMRRLLILCAEFVAFESYVFSRWIKVIWFPLFLPFSFLLLSGLQTGHSHIFDLYLKRFWSSLIMYFELSCDLLWIISASNLLRVLLTLISL